MKKEAKIENFDFGFTFGGDDIEDEELILSNSEQIKELELRLNLLYSSIIPFLDNLCKNPEKSTIHWPNRVEKIQEYKDKLKQIKEGAL